MGCEGGPSPSTFVAYAVTVTLVDGAHQGEEPMSNHSLQTPLPQDEAEIVVEAQMLPEVESV